MPAQKSVHVVDEVEGVGQPHDPEQRQQRIERDRTEPVQAVIEREQDRRQRDLGDQLGRGLQRQPIVDQTGAEHQRGSHHQHRDVAGEPEHRRAAEHDGGNRDAAEKGNGAAMPAVVPGAGDEAEP